MDRIVSNATPLIYLAKADKLILLQRVIKNVLIPEAVFQEVVAEGKRLGEKDAFRVEKAIAEGWLEVKEVKKIISFQFALHSGEIEVISLAKEKEINAVLIDDTKARSAAEIVGLKPVGTLWIILQAVKAKIIDFDECLSTLEDIIDSGFYLKDEIYIKVIRAARKLSGDAL
jgi:predicted nucleic acid-binding protein